MLVPFDGVGLVEHVQKAFEAVAGAPLKVGDLHDDGVVREAFDEAVGHTLGDDVGVIVQVAAADVNDGFFQVAQLVPQDVDGNHGNSVAAGVFRFFRDVLFGEVLRAQVLAEAEGLGCQPCLLQLDKNQVLGTVLVAHFGGEVNPEQGNVGLAQARVFVAAHLHLSDLFLQEGRQHDAGYPFVFHHVFEDHVVYGIGNDSHNCVVFNVYAKVRKLFWKRNYTKV